MAATAHAKLSASGAHRWLACPASVTAEADLPATTSPYAAEGTTAHELAEHCLRSDVDADTYVAQTLTGLVLNDDGEMIGAVNEYLDEVRAVPGLLCIEQRVDYSPWVPGGFGTVDALILDDTTATVIDFKYGRGVRVEAEDNPQLMLYALGALHEFGFAFGEIETVRLMVVQPRLGHLREHEISRADLLNWAETHVKPAADLALSTDAPFRPGETQCRFCRAKATCRALADHNLKLATDEFTDIGNPVRPRDPAKLSLDEIAALLPQLSTLTDWAQSVVGYATGQAEAGTVIPGYKLVAGRATRKWADDAEAETALRKKLKVAEVYTKKLISPAQAEKALGKDHAILKQHAIKPDGKPTLVADEDPRPALQVDPTEGFENAA